MAQKIVLTTLSKEEYLKNPVEIGLDKDWSNKSQRFDQRLRSQGIYIIHTVPSRVFYVGKTRGLMMDFATRLYRHATKAASGNSKTYRALKEMEEETKGPILVSLVTKEQLRGFFEGMQLKDHAMIDIYEQVLIHILEPQLQK